MYIMHLPIYHTYTYQDGHYSKASPISYPAVPNMSASGHRSVSNIPSVSSVSYASNAVSAASGQSSHVTHTTRDTDRGSSLLGHSSTVSQYPQTAAIPSTLGALDHSSAHIVVTPAEAEAIIRSMNTLTISESQGKHFTAITIQLPLHPTFHLIHVTIHVEKLIIS